MRVLFLGTPAFAVPSLEALAADPEIEVVAVITQPDRPAGRGRRLTPPPVKETAQRMGLPVRQFESIRANPEALELIRSTAPDVGVVVAFGQILPKEFFAAPPWGTLNVHASLLPAYRGAAPVVHALLNGDSITGVTIMRIDEGMDTGDILARREVPVPPDATAGELEELLAREGARLLVVTLRRYVSGELQPVPQDHAGATYAPRLPKEAARVDWSLGAWAVHNLIRAMNPRPGAFACFREQEVKLWRSVPPGAEQRAISSGRPGEVVGINREGVMVACGDGVLTLTELQLPGRKRVSGVEFANGVRLETGERFA
ncbi:MAG TPA: methionyl-tRNA formyltransferase [Acidobacteriota bacterium]|jgi:methionyl-tRNA formyltransferase|nr:methionyl-tRNA formyltransferase [Acidobacteriota bacterium]